MQRRVANETECTGTVRLPCCSRARTQTGQGKNTQINMNEKQSFVWRRIPARKCLGTAQSHRRPMHRALIEYIVYVGTTSSASAGIISFDEIFSSIMKCSRTKRLNILSVSHLRLFLRCLNAFWLPSPLSFFPPVLCTSFALTKECIAL